MLRALQLSQNASIDQIDEAQREGVLKEQADAKKVLKEKADAEAEAAKAKAAAEPEAAEAAKDAN